jgi:hypothetical protein
MWQRFASALTGAGNENATSVIMVRMDFIADLDKV